MALTGAQAQVAPSVRSGLRSPRILFSSIPFFRSCFFCSCCGQNRVLCRGRSLEQALHSPSYNPVLVFSISLSLFLPLGTISVYLATLIPFISIGHIIASETEEAIFRILGTLYHYICIVCEDKRRACTQAVSIGGAGA